MSGTIPLKIRGSKSENQGSGTRTGTQNFKTRHPGPRFLRRGIAELNFAERPRDKIFSGTRPAPVHNNCKPGFDLELDQPSYDSKMLYLARIIYAFLSSPTLNFDSSSHGPWFCQNSSQNKSRPGPANFCWSAGIGMCVRGRYLAAWLVIWLSSLCSLSRHYCRHFLQNLRLYLDSTHK